MSHLKNIKREARVLLPSAGETYTADDGTVSQILEGTLDTTQDPTEEEIDEYATWLGMQLPQDAEFLWIAKEGLKTPLPKEWRPCRTSEGDVYYFNFKNGESLWEHPLDQMFRKKFEAEKARVMEERSGGAALGLPSGATATGGAVSRVLLTDSGVLRKDPSRPTPQPATSSSAEGGASTKPPTPQPHGVTALSSSAAASRTTRCEAPSPATTTTASPPPSQTELPPGTSPAGGGQRIVSEAERALEVRIRAELEQEWNKELSKAQALHASQLSALRHQHETEAKTLRDEDAAGRAEAARRASAAADEQRAQARRRCAEKFGPQLEQLEQETNTLRTRLGKLDEEYQRAAGGEPRAALERRAAEGRQARLSAMQADMVAQRRRTIDEARARWAGRVSALRTQSHDAIQRVRAAAQKTRTEHEIVTVQAAEVQRKEIAAAQGRVVAELQAVQGDKVAEASGGGGTKEGGSAVAVTKSAGSLEARCKALRTKAAQAQAQLRQEKDRLLTTLRRQWLELNAAAKASAAAPSPSPAAAAAAADTGKTSGGPIAVTLVRLAPTVMGGPSAAPRTAMPAAATTAMSAAQYEHELADLRARYARKTRETMDALAATRQRKLAEAAAAAAAAAAIAQNLAMEKPQSKTATELSTRDATQAVRDECAAELRQLEAAYQATQDRLRAELAQELSRMAALDTKSGGAAGGSQGQLVQTALEVDMAAYVQEVEARRGRMAAEFAVRKSKQVAEQDAAKATSARRMAEQQARRLRERAAAAEALIDERVAAAVAIERARLQRECDALLARRTESYAKERQAMAREVDEEMAAFVQAERLKWQDARRGEAQQAAKTKNAQASRRAAQRRSAAQQRAKCRAEWAELRAEETQLLSLLASQTSRAAAASALLPAGVGRPAHLAELRRLEEQYCAEETSLQAELRRWRTANETLTAQMACAARPTTTRGSPPRSFCTEDAIQYCAVQQNELARRQRYLRAARSLWQRESGCMAEPGIAVKDGGGDCAVVSPSVCAAPPVGVASQPLAAEQEAGLAQLLGRLNAQLDSLTRHVARLRQRSRHHGHSPSASPSRSATRMQRAAGAHGTRHMDPAAHSSHHTSPRHSPQNGIATPASTNAVIARKWHAILNNLQDSESGPTWAVYS